MHNIKKQLRIWWCKHENRVIEVVGTSLFIWFLAHITIGYFDSSLP